MSCGLKGEWRSCRQTGVDFFYTSASASSSRVLTTISGGEPSVSNKPPERFIHAACIAEDSAPIMSKGFEEISLTSPIGRPRRFATCCYTLGDRFSTLPSSTLSIPCKYRHKLPPCL